MPLTPYPIDNTSYRTKTAKDDRIRFLVMHYTVGNFKQSIDTLTEQGQVSAHYLIPDPTDPTYRETGRTGVEIFNLVNEDKRAWHAGISTWERCNNLNFSSIGIEMVNQPTPDGKGGFHYPDFNPQQIEALAFLSKDILNRYKDITPTRVVGHADISYTRKQDPGPKFPWQQLHDEHGIGAWFNDKDKNGRERIGEYFTYKVYLEEFEVTPPSEQAIKHRFARYGYAMPDPTHELEYQPLIEKFQMHFRPSNCQGLLKHEDIPDAETCAIIYTLCDKYKPEISALTQALASLEDAQQSVGQKAFPTTSSSVGEKQEYGALHLT